MNINDIFDLEQYDEAYEFVNSHEYTSIKDLGNGKYQIIQLHIPTEEEIAQQEAERIAKLHLTRADVFRGILKATGKTKTDIRAMIELLPETTPEEIQIKELARIDFEDSLNFYRGVPIVDILGNSLGFDKEQLDKFFQFNDYKYLLPKEEPEVVPEETIPDEETTKQETTKEETVIIQDTKGDKA